MNVNEFIHKWQRVQLTERSASQQHFLDLCRLVAHPEPAAADPLGDTFTFEKGAAKYGGGRGWADVWKRGFFGWEYKGLHKDLVAAYDQLLRYRESLENPPLLVVCDLDRLVIHTNFTGCAPVVHDIALAELAKPASLEILRAVFHDPERLRPGVTRQAITEEAARRVAALAHRLRERGFPPQEVAHFLDRIVFALFAEDVELLPNKVMSRLLDNARKQPNRFEAFVRELFHAMAQGGFWGPYEIRRFNGNLFANGPVLALEKAEITELVQVAKLDWSAIDPSILGALFERGLDPAKRSQLGAHYTSREDIEALIEPVVFAPLRREWAEARRLVENLLATGKKEPKGGEPEPTGPAFKKARYEADLLVRRFWERLCHVQVLDPACGSGNFLYVTLQKLKDLEKEVLLYGMDRGLPALLPLVGPWQLHGIEVNSYAFELAQMSVWIGYLQWIRTNGFGEPDDPVLRPMDTFELKDAVLDLADPANPREPEWPRVDFLVGNPPFLGGKKLRTELGDEYVDRLFQLWDSRVPREADLVAYWFEKARSALEQGRVKRAGLLATQAIRGGANRRVLERIKQTGDIFFAESDRNWVLDGAAVHVSMVGFDLGIETERQLDGRPVEVIHADLTAAAVGTTAKPQPGLRGLCFQGDKKVGSFELSEPEALSLLRQPNPNSRPSSDVLVPWMNGAGFTRRGEPLWIIDFPPNLPLAAAASYQGPFEIVRQRVFPDRSLNRRVARAARWWVHGDPQKAMRAAIQDSPRFVVCPAVSKHRLFGWLTAPLLPDAQLIVFARSDDFYFGVLHSRFHELWSLRQGTQVRERESGFRYTPTTCFETFPFPAPTSEQTEAIAEAARELDRLRCAWLQPPEWTREEVLEFPGSIDGPWRRYVRETDTRGIGTVRWPRRVAKDEECAAQLKSRTLTALYNQRPAWLDLAHRALDQAVAAAYGWAPDLLEDELLSRLLRLNLERAG